MVVIIIVPCVALSLALSLALCFPYLLKDTTQTRLVKSGGAEFGKHKKNSRV